jgi:hypothetical protein
VRGIGNGDFTIFPDPLTPTLSPVQVGCFRLAPIMIVKPGNTRV